MGRKNKRQLIINEQAGAGRLIVPIIFAIILAMIPFCYGKFLEFRTDGPFDGSLNVYSAKSLLNGQKMGVDTFPSARGATLLVNIIGVGLFGFSEVGPKLIQMVMQITAFGLMYYTVRRIYGSLAACISLVMCAFYLSCPPFSKFGNVKEQYMISCALITACGVLLRYFGGSRKWLMVSGAFAINIYFFKPTGVSVIVASLVYMVYQTILRRLDIKEFYKDLCLLVEGAFIGMVPLFVFYAWQGQLKKYLRFIPIKGAVLGALLLLVVFGIYKLVVFYNRDRQRNRYLVVLAIVLLIVVMLIPFGMLGGKAEGKSYIENTPISAIVDYVKSLLGKINRDIMSGSYLVGSRESTTFRSQYDNVVGYMRAFVVPVGLSLLAIGWRIKAAFTKPPIMSEQPQTEVSKDDKFAESFVVLMAVWWLLDMLFVWISPRSYVEYYLPLNGSAAMLGAYAISRSKSRPGGFIVLMVLWVLLELTFALVIPVDGFPFIGLRSLNASSVFWIRLGVCASIAVGLIFLNLIMKKKTMHLGRYVIIGLACIFVCFWWNMSNIKGFANRVQNVEVRNSGAWQQAGLYIRQNSKPGDGLYVWGWIPGIYVKAQRFSPSAWPSYSNMHSDRLRQIKHKILRTVNQLAANPPKFIVDSQKFHFPYYDHPNFDLWPGWSSKLKGWFYLRYYPGQSVDIERRLTLKEMREYSERYYHQVEERTYLLLTNPRRKGGAIPEEQAREMAKIESNRHNNMNILREFVMANYEPDCSIGGINIYRLRE